MKLTFGTQCFIALVLGALFGLTMPLTLVDTLSPLGEAYLQLLRMIIVPITFVLIVTSFTKLENIHVIKNLGSKTLFWFFLTALIAASVGLITALWFDPGSGFHAVISNVELKPAPPLSQILLEMVPGNLIEQMSHGKIIPIILFAILFALALTLCGERTRHVRQFFDELAIVIFKITRWVIRLSPIAIFVFISAVAAHYGLRSLIPFAKFILTIYTACLMQMMVYGLLLFFVARTNPFKFAHTAWPMLVTGFTTSSSLATLPIILDTLKKLKIPEQVASFVAPLGVNAKMDGCGAIFPAVICIFTASLFQIPLDWHQYLTIILTAAITTIGSAGVPGSAVVMTMVVLSSLGLPFTGLALVIGIDKTVDMIRTTTNVAGTSVCAVLVAQGEKQSVYPHPEPIRSA